MRVIEEKKGDQDDDPKNSRAFLNDENCETSHGIRLSPFPWPWGAILSRFQVVPPSSVRKMTPRLPTIKPKPSLPKAMPFKLRRGVSALGWRQSLRSASKCKRVPRSPKIGRAHV